MSPLRTVLLHRPGPELARLTSRNDDFLLFDGIPWVGRAQEEHDAFAAALRERGVEVLYLGDLLAGTLAVPEARAELTDGCSTTGGSATPCATASAVTWPIRTRAGLPRCSWPASRTAGSSRGPAGSSTSSWTRTTS